MPAEQLQRAMTDAYGEDWESLFYGFEVKPLAAASIGQVHRCISPDGREIVLKVQYPGVATSIDLRHEAEAGRVPDTRILMLLDRDADQWIARQAKADAELVKPVNAFQLKRAALALLDGE